MLQSYFIPMPPNETNDEFQKRQNGYVIDTINEAQDFILSMYGEYCEAARILRENKLRARVDMPEERAGILADLLASFSQAKIYLECS